MSLLVMPASGFIGAKSRMIQNGFLGCRRYYHEHVDCQDMVGRNPFQELQFPRL